MFHVKRDGAELAENGGLFHVKHNRAEEQSFTKLLVAGGRPPKEAWLESFKDAFTVYCADKGASYALKAGLSPALVVGDCDSASVQVYEQSQRLGARLDIHPPAKDDTDLQLLLKQLPEGNVVATGIWGGRFDHLLSNVYSLLAFKEERNCQVVMADAEELMVLLSEDESLVINFSMPAKLQAISLLPLSAKSNISIAGVRWPLTQAELTQQRPYAISDELMENSISCSCHSGKIGLYLHWHNG